MLVGQIVPTELSSALSGGDINSGAHRLLCLGEFWKVLEGSLGLSAFSIGLFLLFVARAVRSVLGCLTGLVAACIHVYLTLLREGVSSTSSQAAAIWDLSLHSQLFKLVFLMNSFYSDVEELRSSGLRIQALFSYQYMT